MYMMECRLVVACRYGAATGVMAMADSLLSKLVKLDKETTATNIKPVFASVVLPEVSEIVGRLLIDLSANFDRENDSKKINLAIKMLVRHYLK